MSDIATLEGRERVRHMNGVLNLPAEQRLAHINSSIRRGLSQIRGHAPNDQTLCLVGSGPSLESTLPELQALAGEGCPVVALNGAYGWLLEHGVKPTALVIIDGRAFNARFVTEHVDGCSYFFASQCAPELFDKVHGWPKVFLWHCLTGDDPVEKAVLDGYYMNSWQPVAGGCTVGSRAIVLFRILGFQKMHLFGMDSCYLDGKGHANDQPENDGDDRTKVVCAGREFLCSAWHCEQGLELCDLIATNGEHFQLSIHGNGLLAYILEVGGSDEGLEEQLKAGADA